MMSERIYTSRDLLYLFLDLKGLSPDLECWTEKALAGNPPRLYRLQRLMALFRAFGVPWDLECFVQGRFIPVEDPRYAPLLAGAAAELHGGSLNRVEKYQLQKYFNILFKYRAHVEGVLTFSHGVLAASGLYRHAHDQVGKVNRVIRDEVSRVDGILATLVDPGDRTFTVTQLVEEYGFPDVDLSEVDLDWF